MFTRIFYKSLSNFLFRGTGYNFTEKRYDGSSTIINGSASQFVDYFKNAVTETRPGYQLPSTRGVYFGNGNATPSITDYKLAGELFTNFTSSHVFTMNDDATATITYTLTNTGDTSFTIKEVGIFSEFSSYGTFLAYRDLLETPITIEPGGVGQVTLTFDVNIPS